MDDWDGNGCTVKLKPETVAAAMRRECKCCHAPIFTTKQSAPYKELFHGTLTQTSVYPREVLKAALKHNAGAVIFAHNHPSGHPEPSHADKILTTELKNALALIDVRVLDHIVVGGAETISFAERGLL
jgi:DNA repair protein RadC